VEINLVYWEEKKKIGNYLMKEFWVVEILWRRFWRRPMNSMARAIVSYWAVREMGYPGIEIGRILNLTGPAVTRCVERGKKILDENEELKYKLIS